MELVDAVASVFDDDTEQIRVVRAHRILLSLTDWAAGYGNDMELVFKRPEGVEDRTRMRFTDDGRLAWTLKGGTEIMLRRE